MQEWTVENKPTSWAGGDWEEAALGAPPERSHQLSGDAPASRGPWHGQTDRKTYSLFVQVNHPILQRNQVTLQTKAKWIQTVSILLLSQHCSWLWSVVSLPSETRLNRAPANVEIYVCYSGTRVWTSTLCFFSRQALVQNPDGSAGTPLSFCDLSYRTHWVCNFCFVSLCLRMNNEK